MNFSFINKSKTKIISEMDHEIITMGKDEKNISDEDNIDNEKSKPHNGKPINMMEISPNAKYIVSYSEEDNTIVGWNVEDIEEGRFEPDDTTVKPYNTKKRVYHMCVSDEKKLVLNMVQILMMMIERAYMMMERAYMNIE